MKHLLLIATFAACSQSAAGTDPTLTDPQLTARRGQLLGYLAEYTERGEFPTDDKGLPTSIFKDASGVRCPMAELMFRSGHPELVDAIAAEDNHLQLADVHDGPVHDWMLGSGLTRDEIVMIQGAPRDLEVNFQIELPREIKREIITAQRERVRGRLEMAQSALRKDSRDSLAHATAVLPEHRVPTIKVARPVLAKRAR